MGTTVDEIKKKFTLPSRFHNPEESIWNVSTALGLQYKCTDLAQGFPNFLLPDYVLEVLREVQQTAGYELQQYTRDEGHPRLVKIIASLYSRIYNRELDPKSEILITCGAYESLYCAINGNIDPGDEVIIIEPAFDCYEPMALVAGATVKHIPLRKLCRPEEATGTSADWTLDEPELRSIFNEKTKILVLNTPMNPTGKVFSMKELQLIAKLCIKYNTLCVSDEVYEWHVYEPAKHVKIATLPGMWERTITVSSAGKSLCTTGWKCGWSIGPANLLKNSRVVHKENVETYITPIQEAVARCLEKEYELFYTDKSLFRQAAKIMTKKRDYFVQLLREAGFEPIVPEGSYFMVADWTKLGAKLDLSKEPGDMKDYKFMYWLVKNTSLLTIPTSVFYSAKNKHIGEKQLRFCFFKTEELLEAASKCMKKIETIRNNK